MQTSSLGEVMERRDTGAHNASKIKVFPSEGPSRMPWQHEKQRQEVDHAVINVDTMRTKKTTGIRLDMASDTKASTHFMTNLST